MATKTQKKSLLILLLIIAAGFLLLTIFVSIDPIPKVDREFSEEIQEHSNPTVDAIMHCISWVGYMPNSAIIVGAVALLFFVFKYRREALFVLLTALSGIVSTGVKMAVNRPRPLPSMVRILEKTHQQSFPSGHVIFYTVFFGFIALVTVRLKKLKRPLRISIGSISLFMVFIVPLSRVYLGAHWFTDVIAGFFLGVICLYLLGYFYLKPGLQSF
ncbi:phosphatase PAP2 family protein [Mucilaginibacter segetis]|uniref:Phosphatase PAP2 family protein n=1 Tax=Mucilaginibacter segetis TaxID=2793071 RepID=A0A934PRX6_9SPHI|nr:phosphatase PAP2 family protein [Mucilaginibacter segetis]MBK0378511.1 phosphatase PAP2 family protein [Mucilaginibacter segetis]